MQGKAIFFLAILSSVNAFSTFIKAKAETCFMEEAKRGERVLMSFAVVSGGFMDIDVNILGPDQKNIYKGERENEGDVQFFAGTTGLHRLCFGNTMSTVTGKTVSFNMYVGDSLSQHDAATGEHMEPLDKSISEMRSGLVELANHQQYMRKRENRHRETVDSTNSRVVMWNLLETVSLVFVGVFQIWWLKRGFEKKRSM